MKIRSEEPAGDWVQSECRRPPRINGTIFQEQQKRITPRGLYLGLALGVSPASLLVVTLEVAMDRI